METFKHLPAHPGEVLKEELEYRKISQKRFAGILGVSYTMLNEILNGKRAVTIDLALMVEAALGINPEMLINLQSRYNMAVAQREGRLSDRLQEIRRLCALL